MTAVRPRVQVSLADDVAETVRRVAAVQGRSMSAVIGELVTEMEPGLRRVAELGEQLERVSVEQRAAIQRAIEWADAEVAPPLEQAFSAMSRGLDEAARVGAGNADLTPPR